MDLIQQSHQMWQKKERDSAPYQMGCQNQLRSWRKEESARMPDSPFTRLLRIKGRHPAWYSATPDHETD
ncbi:CCG-binding protein 1 [Prunus yedoensis var. nudiflora]|uniref:CCG-binding protein 1 n=1 Tax=Prunus yedoensis var. nudiflora TaxID=2094558 RepID=A0A314UHV8_PRUYE|nr:CCG-binding protein 1 [Prunus yedoensis var. nudiflora]